MATPPPKMHYQDMPPPGGFTKPINFPDTGFRKRSPPRFGFGGVYVIGIGVAITGLGLAAWFRDMGDRKCVCGEGGGGVGGGGALTIFFLPLRKPIAPNPPTTLPLLLPQLLQPVKTCGPV